MNDATQQSSSQPTGTTAQRSNAVKMIMSGMRGRSSIGTRLTVAFLTVTLLSLGLLAFLNNFFIEDALTKAANQALLAAASQTAFSLDDFITVNQVAVRTEAQLTAFADYLRLSPDERQSDIITRLDVIHILRSLSRKDPEFIASYALLDRQGRNEIDTVTSAMGSDESDNDYFQIPLQSHQAYVSPVRFEEDGQAYFYFSAPIRGSDGVLRVRYRAAVLQHLIEQNSKRVGNQSFGVLFDENYIHLAHSTEPETRYKAAGPLDPVRIAELQADRRLPDRPTEELSTNLPDLEQNLANATAQPFFEAIDVATGDKVNQVAVTGMQKQPWQTQPWLVAFFQPQEVFLAPVQEQTRNTLAWSLLIVVGVIIVAIVLARRLASPITRLTAVAQQVAGGNLMVEAPVESQDEAGQLAVAFNSMTAQLRHLIGSLKEQVQERTAELTLSIEVGQRAAAIRDLDELLLVITEFIRKQFGLYHVQVYLIDDIGDQAVLKASTSEVGQELLARRHCLPLGPGSIVGQVAAKGQTIVVPDTENSDIHKANPLLPETRSELAVPLVIGGFVYGVLDMQANRVNTFTENNLTVFEAMATQLAVSIDTAQQWAFAQEAQQKMEAAINKLTRETWAEKLTSKKQKFGFTYDLSAVTPLESQISQSPEQGQNGGISVPLVVQNEPIGQLSVEMPARKSWTEDEHSMLEAVAQQLAQKAENLRLFEQTQQRATREQITRQITDKIRASHNIEMALKTAVEELSKALNAPKAVIDLKVAQADETDDATRGK